MKTIAIIFSRNRTLQLKSLLLSLRHYSNVPEESIRVIFKADDEISYEPLIREFKCKFLRQGDFLEDIKRIARECDSGYIWFMVDDLIYRDSFSLRQIENYMESHRDVDSFCLRLGRNITAKGRQPDFIREDGEIMVWDAKKGQGSHWNYFWELSSSIYRKPLVLEYLSKCRPHKECFPNPLESHYYSCMPNTCASGLAELYLAVRFPFRKKSGRLACFKESKCFTHGVNIVAELNNKRQETYSYNELHQKMLEGYLVDFISRINIENPNPGGKYFRLIKPPTASK